MNNEKAIEILIKCKNNIEDLNHALLEIPATAKACDDMAGHDAAIVCITKAVDTIQLTKSLSSSIDILKEYIEASEADSEE